MKYIIHIILIVIITSCNTATKSPYHWALGKENKIKNYINNEVYRINKKIDTNPKNTFKNKVYVSHVDKVEISPNGMKMKIIFSDKVKIIHQDDFNFSYSFSIYFSYGYDPNKFIKKDKNGIAVSVEAATTEENSIEIKLTKEVLNSF